MRNHNTAGYYQCLMYEGLGTLDILHKKICEYEQGYSRFGELFYCQAPALFNGTQNPRCPVPMH